MGLQKWLLVSTLCFLLLAVDVHQFRNLFESTLDTDGDGHFGIEDWVDHFNILQPDHSFNHTHLQETFDVLDQNSDGRVYLQEMMRQLSMKVGASIVIKQKFGPKQIHLGLTGKDNEMQVMWVTQPDKAFLPVVHYGPNMIDLSTVRNATWQDYNEGHIGFHGRIYRAVMQGLQPGRRYYYKVGDAKTGNWSKVWSFVAPPSRNQHLDRINFAVFGDMGTYAPMGFAVSYQLNLTNMIDPFDFVFLTGDVSYAGMNSEKHGETEPIWDIFGELCEKWAASVPFMPGVGNHERYYNYTAYQKRYYLPRSEDSGENFWWSFDYGQLHVIHISSEHNYTKGSPQYQFIEKDLKQASSNPNTQWIILGAHRPFYCSSTFEFAEHTQIAIALEELVNKYKVDIVQTGHVHAYQRTWPLFNGTARKDGQTISHYTKPSTPIYVTQGTAGALMGYKWVSPTPEWSAHKGNKYGYGKIEIRGNSLKYQYIWAEGGKVLDEWYIVK